MGETDMTLDKLPVGQTRRIAAVGGQGALRRRLLDMGLTPKTQVTVQPSFAFKYALPSSVL